MRLGSLGRRLLKTPAMFIAILTLLAYVAAALLSPLIVRPEMVQPTLGNRLLPPGQVTDLGLHVFGTDTLGRDIFQLLVAGARPTLLLAVTAVLASGTVGVTAGAVAGFFEGAVGTVLMRLADLQLAFPFFLLAVSVSGILGPSFWVVLAILTLSNWVPYARVVRAEILELKRREFVAAARALGARDHYLLLRHVMPNVVPSVAVLAAFNLASAIILESSLSFVGLGLTGTLPSWGRLLSEGRNYVATAWWLSLFPGLAIFLIVFACNLLGEYIREVVDPTLRQ